MAGVNLNVRSDVADLDRAFRNLINTLQDPRDAYRDIGEYLMEQTEERFRRQVDPDYQPWAPNSPVTLARKSGNRILRDSGLLQDSIRYQITREGVSIGSNRVYAAMMQFGGTKAEFPWLWGDIPARPFIGVDQADRLAILAIMERHLVMAAQPRASRGGIWSRIAGWFSGLVGRFA